MKHKEEKTGEIVLAAEVILHAFFPILANYGAKLIPPIQFLAYSSLIALPLFLAAAMWRKELHEFTHKKALPLLWLYSLLILIPYLAVFIATKYTSGINTTLFMQSEVIYSAILCWVILGERVTKNRLIGVILIAIASFFILFNGRASLNLADVVLLLSPALFVLANITSKKLYKYVHWSTILSFRYGITVLVLLPIAHAYEGLLVPESSLWLFLVFFGLIPFGLSKIMWQLALERLDVAKCTAIGMTYPAISLVLAYFILDEVPSFYQWVGIGIMSIGLGFIMKTKSKQYDKVAHV